MWWMRATVNVRATSLALLVLAACGSKSSGGGPPELVAQELSNDAVTVKGALPEGWARNDKASLGGLRLETKDKDGMVTGAISVARAMSMQKAKELASDRAKLETTYGADHVINSGVEIAPNRFGNAINQTGKGTAEGTKRVEAKVYWDTSNGVAACTVVMDAPSAETAYALCKDLEVTLK